MSRTRLGILISGRGSNMAALLEACAAADYPAEVALVVSNRADAAGLARAEAAGVATRVIDHRGYDGRAAFDAALTEALAAAGVELVCLAGFMRLLSAGFVEHWQDRLINIHPSLLPAFKGLDVHERVLAAGVRVSGATVHFVRAEMDDGPIIAQGAAPSGRRRPGPARRPGARSRAPHLPAGGPPDRRGPDPDPRRPRRDRGRGPARRRPDQPRARVISST